MTLDREVAAVEVIEVVHTDRKFVAVETVALLSHDPLAGLKHHRIERDFEHSFTAAEDQAVFGHDQLERPCVVGHVVRQRLDVIADPLSSPRSGLEPRTHTESVAGETVQTAAQIGSFGPRNLRLALAVDHHVDFRQQRLLMTVEHHPVHEVETLVHLLRRIGRSGSQIRDAARTRAELNLVLRNVDIEQQAVPAGKRSADADQDVHPGSVVGTYPVQLLPVEELFEPERSPESEDRIVAAQIGFDQTVDLGRLLHGRTRVPPDGPDAERFEGLVQFTAENIETDADVTVDNHPFRSGDPTRQRHIIAKDFLLAQIVRRIDVVLVYACFRLLDGKYKLCGFS